MATFGNTFSFFLITREYEWTDSRDVGNSASCSRTFSRSSLYIGKFSVHVLLKPHLKDFEHYLASL